MVRILRVKEEGPKIKIGNRKVPKKEMSKKRKVTTVVIIIGVVTFGVFFVSGILGAIFQPFADELMTGWADIEPYYLPLSGESPFVEYDGECLIDLYYLEDNEKYEEDLTLDDFPYYIEKPSTFLIRDTDGKFEYQYDVILGNPDEVDPFINKVYLKREVNKALVNVNAIIANSTYLDYDNPDLLNPIITEYFLSEEDYVELPYPNSLPFGDYNTRLLLNVTGIPIGYVWGAASIIPPDYFEMLPGDSIARKNEFNRKGLFLGFDVPVNISTLEYSAEGNFFLPLNTHKVEIEDNPVPKFAWIVLAPEVSYDRVLEFRFTTCDKVNFKNIYLWSGILDDYDSHYIYNNHTQIWEVE